ILFYSGFNVTDVSALKSLSCNLFVELDIAFGYRLDISVGHLRNLLTFFTLKSVFYKPLADEFLRQLFLFFAFVLSFLISVSIKIAGRVGSVYFVYKNDFAVCSFPEFIFGIYEDESLFGGYFGTALKQRSGVG